MITYFILDYNPEGKLIPAMQVGAAIESVRKHSRHMKDFYVISQGCKDKHHREHLQINAREFGYDFIDLGKNLGISRGINFAANMARTKYVCMVSSDCIITHDMEGHLLEALQKDSKCQMAIPYSQKSEIEYQEYSPPSKEFGHPHVSLAQPDVECIGHEFSVAMWPRQAFENVGYYDERWKACYENLDWALRANVLGYNVKIVGSAFAWHAHGGCIKSGARESTYDGYLEMQNGFDQTPLANMWRAKWPGFDQSLSYQTPPPKCSGSMLAEGESMILPYIQEVDY